MNRTPTAVVAVTVLVAVMTASCTAAVDATASDRLRVIASTEILADWTEAIGGDRVEVDMVIPLGGDPHSYEPSPRDAGKITSADLALTNGLLLEDHGITKLFDANVPDGVPNIAVAEHTEPYGAALIPLVEDVGLDVIWLGFGVRGQAPSRSSDVHLHLTDVTGPGEVTMFLTDAVGHPQVYWNTADGLDDSDVITLPSNAHTHVNWTFSTAGVYRLTMAAGLEDEPSGQARDVAETTFTFAVGVNPREVTDGATVLDDGHTDLTVDLDADAWLARDDDRGELVPADTVIDVPPRSIEQIPAEEPFGFLGEPGADIYQLPQAVLGKHVHGEIDPHLWQDVQNARAYVQVIFDALVERDPDGRETYKENLDAYLEELEGLDDHVGTTIAKIPEEYRQLVTTHDAFGYLAEAYGMQVAGFVVPNPAAEPSAEQVRKLTATIDDLGVPAVFVEPNLHTRAEVLRQVAHDRGVEVCTLHGDALPPDDPTYLEMLRQNADELYRCLGEHS